MELNKQPLLILVICFILGIFFQDKFLLEDGRVYFVMIASLVILLALLFHSYFLHKTKALILGTLFFCVGIILDFFNTNPAELKPFGKEKRVVVFMITQKLNSTEKYKKYEGIAQLENRIKSVFYLPKNSKDLDFVHYYKSEVFITKPYSPQYDFQFDYSKYLKRKNIQYQIYLSKEILSAGRNDLNISDKIRQQRFEVLKKIDEVKISATTREFLKGIILADRTEMDADTIQDFNKSGLVHFLAISGTHIVVIFGMVYFLMIRLVPLRFRSYTVIFSLLFIWLFSGFIGFGNSVLRSCIMLSVYFIYVLLQRKPDMLHSLALSAFIILILDTQQLFEVGFQLSFIAVLGIFWLNKPLLDHFPKQDTYLKKLVFNTITISLSAQLATLPLVLYYFHQFSFISIIANFIVVPFSEVIIVFSFLMTTLIAIGFDFELINILYDFIIQILLKVIHELADVDKFFFDDISVNLVEVLLASIIVYLLRPAVHKFDFRNTMNLIMAVLMFFMVRAGYCAVENQKEEILLHDSGRNKVLSVKTGGKVCFWISDMADRDKILRFIVKPYCSSRRVDRFIIKPLPGSVQKVVFKDQIYDIK